VEYLARPARRISPSLRPAFLVFLDVHLDFKSGALLERSIA